MSDPTSKTTDPRRCGLAVRAAIKCYGGITDALSSAETVAAWILASDQANRPEETTADIQPWAARFIRDVRSDQHGGDCGIAPSWRVAPVTCSACVYEKFVAQAFEWLRIENGDNDA